MFWWVVDSACWKRVHILGQWAGYLMPSLPKTFSFKTLTRLKFWGYLIQLHLDLGFFPSLTSPDNPGACTGMPPVPHEWLNKPQSWGWNTGTCGTLPVSKMICPAVYQPICPSIYPSINPSMCLVDAVNQQATIAGNLDVVQTVWGYHPASTLKREIKAIIQL